MNLWTGAVFKSKKWQMSKIHLCPIQWTCLRRNRVRFFSKSMIIKLTLFSFNNFILKYYWEMCKPGKPTIPPNFHQSPFILPQQTINLSSSAFKNRTLPHCNTVDFIDCVILYGFPLNPISCNIWRFWHSLNIIWIVVSSFSCNSCENHIK